MFSPAPAKSPISVLDQLKSIVHTLEREHAKHRLESSASAPVDTDSESQQKHSKKSKVTTKAVLESRAQQGF
jgi:hypothetical protein